ncbi:MAG: hypothetical protein WDN28_17375 [Chthoniobacter sp.]
MLVFLITGGLKGGSLLGWKAGWMWDDSTFLDWCQAHLGHNSLPVAAVAFWPVNFGILPLLVVMLVLTLCRKDGNPWARPGGHSLAGYFRHLLLREIRSVGVGQYQAHDLVVPRHPSLSVD